MTFTALDITINGNQANKGKSMISKKLVSQPITKETNDKLVAISKKRKAEGSLIRSKQDILTKLIADLYKKEVE